MSTATKTAPAPTPRLLTVREAAETLSISPRKLWELTAGGKLRAVRIGRAVRYAHDDLVAFISECRG